MIRSGQESHALSMDEKVAAACRDAGKQVIEIAERTNTAVIVWREGKIVRLSAAEARAELNQKRDHLSTPN
jgi:hypothetical protein